MRKLKVTALFLSILLCFTSFVGCGKEVIGCEPIKITIWTYYNGTQLDSFNTLVEEFNKTVGAENNIIVESHSQGSVNDLEVNLRNAAEGKVGADPLPNIFSAYSDTAYFMDKQGLLVNLKEYMTQREISEYVTEYIQEGDIAQDGSLKILPIAKSTELLFLNDTDWHIFASETGSEYEELRTIEGLVQVAQRYYEWTDAMTEKPDDGRAFFGRDAMANYMLAGAKELGSTIFDVDKDGKMQVGLQKEAARKLWDCYYVPFIKGYFAASGRFRSDDVKTGNVLAYVGSNSSATFFPEHVFEKDNTSYSIKMKVLPCPNFEGCEKYAVQQGAGMVVTKNEKEEIEASVLFLKWFTKAEHNLEFTVHSGYLPVMKEANSIEAVKNHNLSEKALSADVEAVLEEAFRTVREDTLCISMAFERGNEARSILEYAMSDMASNDRKIVEERIEQGISAEEAMREFLTDEYFEAWYQTLITTLEMYEE